MPVQHLGCYRRCTIELMQAPESGVLSGNHCFTEAEIGEQHERRDTGHFLRGVTPGGRVARLNFDNHQLLEGYCAVPLARALVMPLNVHRTSLDLMSILNHAEPPEIV
jgi:acyl-CoA synthetase (AMP-forming)/AMP-acid ligase II